MGYGGIFGQTVNAFTKDQTFSSTTQALYPSGTTLPDEALALLAQAALYKTVTPTAQLGTLPEGSVIYLNENGSPVPFYVAKQGYESDYNTDRVLVVRKELYDNIVFDSDGINAYATSDIDTWLNNTYKNSLDQEVQTEISATTFQYTPGNGTNTVGTLSRSIFALSFTEFGGSGQPYANVEGSALPISNTINTGGTQWTRTPYTLGSDKVWVLNSGGSASYISTTYSYEVRPAFTLPTTFEVTFSPISGLYDLSNNLLLTLPGVQIETGSYTGTGTYGSDNPNKLTFGFVPKIVVVYGKSTSGNSLFISLAIICTTGGYSTAGTPFGNSDAPWKAILSEVVEKTISWFTGATSSGTSYQLNNSGTQYQYIAIG